ncbi:MAG: hypothetical protein N2313_03075 [Meiothermus ruber]|jgi:uncharacterized protein involved in exopolysaccharide biosynthesis|nr:hypothetical protein [Meiothermus ruber]
MRSTSSINDFDRLLLSFSRYMWALLGVSVLIAVVAYLLSISQPRIYEASARLLSAQPVELGSTISAPRFQPLAAAAYREAAYGTLVLEQMNRRFPGVLPSEVAKVREKLRIRSIETVGSSSIVFVLSARDSDPRRSAALANAWAEALRNWEEALIRDNFKRASISLENRIRWVDIQISQTNNRTDQTVLRELRTNLERELGIIRSLENSATGQLSLLAQAEVPTEAIWPRPLLTAGIAAISTLLLGFILLAVRDRLLGPTG